MSSTLLLVVDGRDVARLPRGIHTFRLERCSLAIFGDGGRSRADFLASLLENGRKIIGVHASDRDGVCAIRLSCSADLGIFAVVICYVAVRHLAAVRGHSFKTVLRAFALSLYGSGLALRRLPWTVF